MVSGAAENGLTGIRKSYGGKAALCDLDLELPKGRITVILGPSGCGKTTLLRILAGLTTPDRGRVVLGGVVLNDPRPRVAPEERSAGVVFQDSYLWPHLTVRRNIAFPLGVGRGKDPRVEAAAASAEISGFLSRYPSELSGGERRRAAIARAIVGQPNLLLFDEPLSGLDSNLRVRLIRMIATIQAKLGSTMVYVTHDQEEALSLADRVVVMREGAVLQEGTPEEVYRAPRSRFVAEFVGIASVFPGMASGGRAETSFGTFAVPAELEGDVLLAVRPEEVRISGEGDFEGRVVGSTYRGDRWLTEVAAADRELLSYTLEAMTPGEEVRVRFELPPVVVLDDEASP